MKKNFLKLAMIVMTVSLCSVMVCGTVDAAGVTAFSDVPEGHWAYQTIMDMTEKGLFMGTSEPIDGVGTFSPDNTMTRAEFITVSLRAMYPVEAGQKDKEEVKDGYWWQRYYTLALEKGVVTSSELGAGDLGAPISREEMAMVMVRCIEQNGETLTQRVQTSQIADFDTVGDYYQDYVLDSYSFGLLCGVDEKGTFAPAKTLTRAEAAAVLCRLLDKEMRVKVEFAVNSGGSPGGGGNFVPGGSLPNDPEPEETLPWENGGKQPADYTWAEFESLTGNQQMAFQNHLGADGFESWMNRVQNKTESNPWDKAGAKQPEDYTWEEFEELTGDQQMAFQNALGASGFESWMNRVQSNTGSNPWDKAGAKQPADYTWEEFESLTGEQQMAFQNHLGADGFESWMNRAQSKTESNPWDKAGAKQPVDYTWEEFEELTGDQQIAFQNDMGADEFERWMNRVKEEETEENPWDKKGAKQPADYTWEEFEELTGDQQIAFQNHLGTDEFERWMNRVKLEETEDNPWDKKGAKKPADYTWAEFEELTGAQQIAFQEYLGEIGFENWLTANQP